MPEGHIYIDGAGESFDRTLWDNTYFDDETFTKVLDGMPIPCTDILWINPEKRVLHLAWRTVYATKGPWMFGGRQRRGETPREAAVRLLNAEVGTEINLENLHFIQWAIYFSKFRKQEPERNGVHDIYFHYCYVADDELVATAQTKLEPKEYDLEHSIRPYTRADLEAIDQNGPYAFNRLILLEEFDRIFGPESS